MATPYVEYVFDGPRLTKVLQTREGDTTTPNGFSDVGTFLLATQGLKPAWEDYLKTAPRGSGTGEINFLPFLPFLSARGWTITPLEVADATEARGINTKDDLAFFQSLYNKTAMKKILVTGGAGFIGSHLCEGLLARGYAVRVLDSLIYGRREWVPAACEFIEGDIRDIAACRSRRRRHGCACSIAPPCRAPAPRRSRSRSAPAPTSPAPRTCCWRRAMPA